MNKMKAAFFGSNQKLIDYVYGAERMAEIAAITDLFPQTVSEQNIASFDLSEIEVIFSTWGMFCISEEQLDRMPKLKAVFYGAGATDHFARPLLKRGIHLISAWKANAIPVAEFTFAQIILGLKNYFALSRSLNSKEMWSGASAGPGTYGATVSLIGAGAISSKVQELLKNVTVNVQVIPSRKERRTVSLEEAFAKSQIVSNHLPNREDNIGVLNGKLFELMPKNAVFINTGRGAQVNEAEMVEVLEKRPDITVLLDVTHPEPPLPGSKLYTLPNVHLSPHIAGSMNDEVRRMADYVIGDFKRFSAGKPVENEVTEKMLLTANG